MTRMPDREMNKTYTPRTAHAVVWINDEIEEAAGMEPAVTAITAMRAKVLEMLVEGEDAYLVEAKRVDPADPEFHRLAQTEGYVPEGCSLWFGVWRTTPYVATEDASVYADHPDYDPEWRP